MLVILSAVPLSHSFMDFQISRLASSCSETVTAKTLVNRAPASISSVKAFNAVPYEQGSLDEVVNRLLGQRVWSWSEMGNVVLEGRVFWRTFRWEWRV